MAESFANIATPTSFPFILNTTDQIVICSCASLQGTGTSGYVAPFTEGMEQVIEMSSIPINGNHVIIQSMANVTIEVRENALFGGARLAIIGPYESLVFEATTDMVGRSTAILVGSGGTATTTLENTGWMTGPWIDNSSNYADGAADTSIDVIAMASSNMAAADFELANTTAGEWMTTEHSTTIAEVATSIGTSFCELFNAEMALVEAQVDLLKDAMTDVGVGASS